MYLARLQPPHRPVNGTCGYLRRTSDVRFAPIAVIPSNARCGGAMVAIFAPPSVNSLRSVWDFFPPYGCLAPEGAHCCQPSACASMAEQGEPAQPLFSFYSLWHRPPTIPRGARYKLRQIQGAFRGAGGESHRPLVAFQWNKCRSEAFPTALRHIR